MPGSEQESIARPALPAGRELEFWLQVEAELKAAAPAPALPVSGPAPEPRGFQTVS